MRRRTIVEKSAVLADKIWYRNHPIGKALLPLSWVFKGVSASRRTLYKSKLLKSTKFSVPIIVVGNITVGGTGKTPLVIAVVQWLQDHGWRPGVVSRGYGATEKKIPRIVTENSLATEVGDEALLITRRCKCPMVVAPNRVLAAQHLLQQFDCNIIISDDGLQHYALKRDLEIVVVHAKKQLGNRRCLPAGPLREPVTRIKQADFVVINTGNTINCGTTMCYGDYDMSIAVGECYNLVDPSQKRRLSSWRSEFVHALAGIGVPQQFFQLLYDAGIRVRTQSLPDHVMLTESHLPNTSVPIVMTEKDAVKCQGMARDNMWVVPISAKVDDCFWQAFAKRLETAS